MAESEETVVGEGNSAVVTNHYNSIKEMGLSHRNLSKILYLRNFNNWIKGMLINESLNTIADRKKTYRAPIRVLDLGCGKGGDIFKWKKSASVRHVIFADIAENSIEDCKKRYNDLTERERSRSEVFSAEFIVADFTRARIRSTYKDPTVELDLVSCQFAFHYCFESLPQTECMLRNVSECLKKGGFFIGTLPDAYEIVKRLKESEDNSFGNDVYRITFGEDIDKHNLPLFGCKYNFHLDGVVDCPEFLVYFPVLEKLAAQFGLKLVKRTRFDHFFSEYLSKGKFLLQRMSALETFPPFENSNLSSTSEGDYETAEEFIKDNREARCVGTMSKTEWEAAKLYTAFIFEKVGVK